MFEICFDGSGGRQLFGGDCLPGQTSINYGICHPVPRELKALAEIVTEDVCLIERFFQPLQGIPEDGSFFMVSCLLMWLSGRRDKFSPSRSFYERTIDCIVRRCKAFCL